MQDDDFTSQDVKSKSTSERSALYDQSYDVIGKIQRLRLKSFL